MKKKKYQKKVRFNLVFKYTFYSIILILLIAFSSYFLYRGLSDKQVENISYNEDNNIDYKVYLKKNDFFEADYLGKDTTYISSLIDYILIDFNYNMKYSKNVTGKYKYYVQATILANKSDDNTKNYWSKKYKLTDEKVLNFSDQTSFNINNSVKVDYQKYNDLLTQFKKQFNVPVDGFLKVELIVESTSKYNKIDKDIKESGNMSIVMPLTQSSVDISITPSVNQNNVKVIKETFNANKEKSKTLGAILTSITIVTLTFVIISIYEDEQKRNKYKKELKRILSTYDGIIVNVSSLKDLSKYNIIKVKNFNELIDAHSEVRMPINYVEVKKDQESVFVLINNDVAWVYKLINK